GLLGQPEPFAALPRLPVVVGALHGRAVDEVVRRGVERPVVPDRVEDLPARERRFVDRPGATIFVAAQDEETLPSADQDRRSHRSLAYVTAWPGSRKNRRSSFWTGTSAASRRSVRTVLRTAR